MKQRLPKYLLLTFLVFSFAGTSVPVEALLLSLKTDSYTLPVDMEQREEQKEEKLEDDQFFADVNTMTGNDTAGLSNHPLDDPATNLIYIPIPSPPPEVS